MDQIQILAMLIQMAFSYIFVSVLTQSAQKQTVTDLKTDLRTTKEDLLSELKNSHDSLLREVEIATKAEIDILTSHIQAIEKGEKKGGQNAN